MKRTESIKVKREVNGMRRERKMNERMEIGGRIGDFIICLRVQVCRDKRNDSRK
jgi:hypothetical protein